jgi:hypothetical protein
MLPPCARTMPRLIVQPEPGPGAWSPRRTRMEHVEHAHRARPAESRARRRSPRAPATVRRSSAQHHGRIAADTLAALSSTLNSACSMRPGPSRRAAPVRAAAGGTDSGCTAPRPRERRAAQLVDSEPLALRYRRTLSEPRHVEQVLDVAVEPLALVQDLVRERLLVLGTEPLA